MFLAHDLHDLADAPRLSKTSALKLRYAAVVDLGNLPEATVAEVLFQWFQQSSRVLPCFFGAAVDL